MADNASRAALHLLCVTFVQPLTLAQPLWLAAFLSFFAGPWRVLHPQTICQVSVNNIPELLAG